MMNKKFVTISMLLISALAITGFAYAHWTKTLTIIGNVDTAELDWELRNPKCYDKPGENDYSADCEWHIWQGDKDVGGPTLLELVDTDGDGDNDTLKVTLQNVYPGYFEDIGFHVHNNGEVPLHFTKIIINEQEFTSNPPTLFLDLNGDEIPDIKLLYGNNVGGQLHPCMWWELSLYILILQNDAIEGQTLTFTIQLVAENWSP